jgi:uncharacterized protein YwqG
MECTMSLKKNSLIFDHSPFQNKDDLCKRSFLGGMPELPIGIRWPRNAHNEPLHFIAQVDFEEVNDRYNVGFEEFDIKFPKTGQILLFADAFGESLWDDDKKAVQVIFLNKDMVGEPIQSSPTDLKGPLLGDGNPYSLIRSNYQPNVIPGRKPQNLPKTPLSMRMVNITPIDYDNSDIYLSRHFEIPEAIKSELSEDRNSQLPSLGWPWLVKNKLDEMLHASAIDIPESYPWNWCFIEQSCQQIHSEIQKLLVSYNNVYSRDKLSSMFKEVLDSTINESEEWIEKASLYKEYEQVSGDTSNKFNNWLKSIPKKLGNPIPLRQTKSEWTFINWISPDRKYKNDYTLWDKLVVGIRSLLGIERKIKDKFLSNIKLEAMLTEALSAGIRSAWPYLRAQEVSENIPKVIVDRLNIDCMPLNYGDGQLHYMFGAAMEIQDLGNVPDQNVLLLQIASDKALSLMWGDVGILQVWINAGDLAKGHFENITFTADCH